MQVKIISPEKVLYSGEAEKIFVPGKKGQFEILDNHAPIISSLVTGKVYIEGTENFELDVLGGFVELHHNEVSICVEVGKKV